MPNSKARRARREADIPPLQAINEIIREINSLPTFHQQVVGLCELTRTFELPLRIIEFVEKHIRWKEKG
jgi:hypothetical protein